MLYLFVILDIEEWYTFSQPPFIYYACAMLSREQSVVQRNVPISVGDVTILGLVLQLKHRKMSNSRGWMMLV